MQIAQNNNLGSLRPPVETTYTEGVTEGTRVLGVVEGFVSQIIGILTAVAGVFFIIYFVLGAFKWVTAGGDSSKVQKARDEMVQGVMGLIVVVAAYALIGAIGTIVGLNILNPAEMLEGIIYTQ